MKIRNFIRRVSDFALGHRALMSGAAFILAIALILTVVNAPAVVGASAAEPAHIQRGAGRQVRGAEL